MNNLCLHKVEISIPHGMTWRDGHQYFLFDPKFIESAVGTHGKRADATGHKSLANNPNLLASIQVVPPKKESGKCNNVSGVIKLAAARPGWGPTIYDIAMTDQPNGIMADRMEVSTDAYKVWDYYRHKRNDVDKKTLDWRYAQWTDRSDDDCDWGSNADYYSKGSYTLDQYMYHKPDPKDDENLLPMDPIDVKSSVDFVDFLSDPLNYTYNLTNGPISKSAIYAAFVRGDEAIQQMIDAGVPADEGRWWKELGMAFFRNEIIRRSE